MLRQKRRRLAGWQLVILGVVLAASCGPDPVAARSGIAAMVLKGDSVPRDGVRRDTVAAPRGSNRAVEFRGNSATTSAPLRRAVARWPRPAWAAWAAWAARHGRANAARRSIAHTGEAAVVGEWRAAPVLGQLGLMEVTMTFYLDGSVVSKADFISFPVFQPSLEYYWTLSTGYYGIDGNVIVVNIATTRAVVKKRGEDETMGPSGSDKRTEIFRLVDGTLIGEDMVLTRLE